MWPYLERKHDISCSTKDKGPVSGSRDFETAVKTLQSMSSWNQNTRSEGIRKNQDAAKCVFAVYDRKFSVREPGKSCDTVLG